MFCEYLQDGSVCVLFSNIATINWLVSFLFSLHTDLYWSYVSSRLVILKRLKNNYKTVLFFFVFANFVLCWFEWILIIVVYALSINLPI